MKANKYANMGKFELFTDEELGLIVDAFLLYSEEDALAMLSLFEVARAEQVKRYEVRQYTTTTSDERLGGQL